MWNPPSAVLFVCLGNICRSPMAEGMLRGRLTRRGALSAVIVDGAGTGAWHVGEPPDPRTVEVLRRRGDPVPGPARQVLAADFDRFDLLLAMDAQNLRDLRRLAPPGLADKAHLVLDPTTCGGVPDPYYGGEQGFDQVYDLLDAALAAWLERWGL